MAATIDTATAISFVVGVILPAVVALVTKELASSKFKNAVLIALSALTSVLVPLVGSSTFDVKQVVTSFATVFGTSLLSYYGVYKPQGITAGIQGAVPGGLGSADVADGSLEDEVVTEGDAPVEG